MDTVEVHYHGQDLEIGGELDGGQGGGGGLKTLSINDFRATLKNSNIRGIGSI